MLAGHQGVSSTLSWVTYTQKSLCLNCGKFATVTIYGSFHYRIPYVCQFMQTDSWTWSFVINKRNYVFHRDKRVLACYASRLQSLSCQFIAQTVPSCKSQMAARPKYIIYQGQVQRNGAFLSISSFRMLLIITENKTFSASDNAMINCAV